VSSAASPSGRWRADQYIGWVQHGFSAIEWIEIRLIDGFDGRASTPVMQANQYVVSMNWETDVSLRLVAPNTIYIGMRRRTIGDIGIGVFFEPDDLQARRQRLIEHKTPLDKWWMYDVSPD